MIEHGEAVEWMRGFPEGSARAVVLDPPYRGPTDAPPRGRDDGAGGQVFGLFSLVHRVFCETQRVLVPGGLAMVFCDFKRSPDVGFSAGLAGLRLSTCVAWTWSAPGTGGLLRNAWGPIMLFGKGSVDAIDRAAVRNWIQADPPRGKVRRHIYQKPPEVFEHVLARVIRPGDLVLDPFAGSGASKAPAEKLGARWRGCDADPRNTNEHKDGG